jgi:hypothetical protein
VPAFTRTGDGTVAFALGEHIVTDGFVELRVHPAVTVVLRKKFN